MRHRHQRIVDDDGEVVGGRAVGAHDDRIADDVGVKPDVAADRVRERRSRGPSGTRKRIAGALARGEARRRRPPARDARHVPDVARRPARRERGRAARASSCSGEQKQRYACAAGEQLLRVRLRTDAAARTAGTGPRGPPTSGPLVPVEAEPAQVVEDRRLRLERRALDVGVLDAQDERRRREPRASSQLKSAVRALPTCSWPVGLGAKRTRIGNSTRPRHQRTTPFVEQRDGVRGDRLAAADGVDALVGLALDADAVDRDAERRRQLPRASRRRAAQSFGRSAITVDVDVDDREAALARRCAAARDSRSRLDASFQRGSVSGKCRPMSPSRGRAENRVGHGVAHDVGVRVAEQPAVEGDRHAAENQRPPLDQPVQVVAGADAPPGRRTRIRPRPVASRAIASATVRSSGVVILMLRGSPSTRRTGCPARSASVASSVASAPGLGQRERVAQHVAAERLRRLRQDRSARAAASRSRTAGPSPVPRFTVSLRRQRASAAPTRRAAAIVRAMSAALANGRAASWITTTSTSRRSRPGTRWPPSPAAARRRPPARSGFGGHAQVRAADRRRPRPAARRRSRRWRRMREERGDAPLEDRRARRRPAAASARAPPKRWPRPPAAMIAVVRTGRLRDAAARGIL